VGVGVDERRQDDVGRVRLGCLDSLDAAVLDDDTATDRFKRLPAENGSLYAGHCNAVTLRECDSPDLFVSQREPR
jgi:hypothetical protein